MSEDGFARPGGRAATRRPWRPRRQAGRGTGRRGGWAAVGVVVGWRRRCRVGVGGWGVFRGRLARGRAGGLAPATAACQAGYRGDRRR